MNAPAVDGMGGLGGMAGMLNNPMFMNMAQKASSFSMLYRLYKVILKAISYCKELQF